VGLDRPFLAQYWTLVRRHACTADSAAAGPNGADISVLIRDGLTISLSVATSP